MKKIFLLSSLATLLFARPVLTLLPYYTYTHYSDQFKKAAHTIGYYGALYNSPHLLELSASYNTIVYRGNYPRYEQSEITTLYSYFLNSKLKMKGGFHFVASDFREANEGLVTAIAGVDYRSPKKNLGLELFHSRYKHYKPKPLTIWQIHPYFGYKFGSFGIRGDYNYIHANNNTLYKRVLAHYHSFGLTLSKKWGRWTTSIGGWIGKRAFALEDGGFTLYNLSQIYTSGIDAKVKYHTRKGADIALKYSRKNYKNGGKKGHSDALTSSFAYSW